MSHKTWIPFVALAILGAIAILVRPAAAEVQPQVVYQTPTAQPDGRVIYVVQDGDTCSRIYLLTKITIETLRSLNKLDQNCTINPGQELLLMVVTPIAPPTIDPKKTPEPVVPSPTPSKGTGKICVMLYNDLNGDAVRQDNEVSMAGGAISISDRLGKVSKTGTTTDQLESLCNDVPEGEYTISMAIPAGNNGTTLLNQQMKVQAGETAILEFGAQASTRVESTTTTEQPPAENNLMLAILGGILVMGGIGLGVYILFSRRNAG